MDETKTNSKTSLIEKFKSLKKSYQIGIVIGIIAIIILIFAMIKSAGVPNTPFAKLDGRPSPETVIKRYGKDYTASDGTSNMYAGTITYDNYKWLGYEGTLKITFSSVRDKDKHNNDIYVLKASEAEWHVALSSKDEAEIKALEQKIVDYFNNKIGNYELGSAHAYGLEYGSWADKHNNTYTLWQVTQWGKSSITVMYRCHKENGI